MKKYEDAEDKLGSQIPSLKNLVLRKVSSFKQNGEKVNKENLSKRHTASVYS